MSINQEQLHDGQTQLHIQIGLYCSRLEPGNFSGGWWVSPLTQTYQTIPVYYHSDLNAGEYSLQYTGMVPKQMHSSYSEVKKKPPKAGSALNTIFEECEVSSYDVSELARSGINTLMGGGSMSSLARKLAHNVGQRRTKSSKCGPAPELTRPSDPSNQLLGYNQPAKFCFFLKRGHSFNVSVVLSNPFPNQKAQVWLCEKRFTASNKGEVPLYAHFTVNSCILHEMARCVERKYQLVACNQILLHFAVLVKRMGAGSIWCWLHTPFSEILEEKEPSSSFHGHWNGTVKPITKVNLVRSFVQGKNFQKLSIFTIITPTHIYTRSHAHEATQRKGKLFGWFQWQGNISQDCSATQYVSMEISPQ